MEGRRVSQEMKKAVVVSCDMVTAFGAGTDALWNGIRSGGTAISKIDRFNTKAFQSDNAAVINGLKYLKNDSLVMQMFRLLLKDNSASIPEDAKLILATTKGEIDLLEKKFLTGRGDASDSNPHKLLKKISALAGVKDSGMIISAACASSSTALARAASMIRSGYGDCVLVTACDSVTEFVYAGFSSLMALEKFAAKPFDKKRSGLSLGEAAVYALLMSDARAKREKRNIIGEIAGWGMSDDANHMTGPSRTSDGLIMAVKKALRSAGADEGGIGFISAHGTGTVYNDAMEMRAFHAVFKNKLPVYSVKGAIGHTLGAAGLVETITALRALKEKVVPLTVNLKAADDDAHGWVSNKQRALSNKKMALITNAGFSGINTALVVK
ncbi:MAG: beta-ketoacyl-[acyl-carrier-protein] synthase family protein [Nitrospirae bacterium]|nr:beta-ketoacyl-[acyl-carrier-protein] synthase family protein [Nitrospirota bacterium]